MKQHRQPRWKAFAALILAGALAFDVAATGISPARNEATSLSSADEIWEDVTGWTDYSVEGNISVQNNSEQASILTYKEMLNGADGFRIRFRVDFVDPAVTTVARISLASDSLYLRYFNILVSGQGSQAALSVGFCNEGVWTAPVVSDTGWLDGADGSVELCISHEAGSKTLGFTLTNLSGDVLYTHETTDKAYQGERFLEVGDLRLKVCPYAGGNCFRFSSLQVEEYPDDGIDNPPTAMEEWSMPAGWEDNSDENGIRITSVSGQEWNSYKTGFAADRDIKISFVVTPEAGKQSDVLMTVGCPTQSAYLRLELHYNPYNGSFSSAASMALNLGYEQNYAWKALGDLPWNWTGSAYRITIEWLPRTHRFVLTREGVEGCGDTVKTVATLTAPIVNTATGEEFFTLCGQDKLTVNFSNAGSNSFTLSDFSVVNSLSAADDWSMPVGWSDLSTIEQVVIANQANCKTENLALNKLSPVNGFDVSYAADFAAGGSEADLRLTAEDDKAAQLVLSMRGAAETAELTLKHGDSVLAASGEQNLQEQAYIRLRRVAGSDALTVALETADGTVLWTQTVTDENLKASNFYDIHTFAVGLLPTQGITTVSQFTVASAPRTAAEQNLYTLGRGWTAYYNDNGELYFTKTDGRENEMVYNPSLHGTDGFRAEYDLTLYSTNLTTTYVKIGIVGEDERLFFSRIKTQNNTVFAEGQVYHNGVWTGNLLSAAAGERRQMNGTIHILLERQQGSDALHYTISTPDGTTLLDETIRHETMDFGVLNNENVRFIIGRDTDATAFRVSNVSVTTYPVVPVAVTDLSIAGEATVQAGQQIQFAAEILPANATVKGYRWSLDGENLGTAAAQSCTLDTVGTYTLCLTVEDYSGNTETAELQITVVPVPAGRGDVNLDGVIDTQDAALLQQYLVGVETLTEAQLAAADADEDGKLTSADAREILLLAQKKDVQTEDTEMKAPTCTDTAYQPVKAPEALTAEEIAAPEYLEYLWNGTFVNDRTSFAQLLENWQLGTAYGEAAVITSGDEGDGLTYSRDMGAWWYAGGTVTFPTAQGGAAVRFTGGESALSLQLSYAENGLPTVTLLAGEETLYSVASATADTAFAWIIDNTRDNAELRLHLTGDKGLSVHIALCNLPQSALAVLSDTQSIVFGTMNGAAQVSFTELCVYDMPNPFEDDPAAALEYYESEVARVMALNRATTYDGREISTPDTSGNYNALWLRDPMWNAMKAPEYYPLEVMMNDLDFTLEHARESDGWIPDHVGFNGAVAMSAGDFDKQIAPAQLDMGAVTAVVMDCVLKKMEPEDREAYFRKWESTIMRGMAAIPVDENGLVYNDPAIVYSTFGVIDSSAPTGSLLECSVLQWKGYTLMAKWQKEFGMDSSVSETEIARIEAALEPTLYNEAYGLLNAATVDNCQADILGSVYAVSMGFPLSEKAEKSIADYLYTHYDEVTQFGAVRHLPAGEYWQRTITYVPNDVYQNGAFWPVFTGWFIDAIKEYYPALAERTLERYITYGYYDGFYECINGADGKLKDYNNSVVSALPNAREMLTVAVESLTVAGAQSVYTGCSVDYKAEILPANAGVRSIVWSVDGKTVGEGETLPCRFSVAGDYTLCVTVTDTNGVVTTQETTVQVTAPEAGALSLTYPAITGKCGDTVTVPVFVSAANLLTSADLRIGYDAAKLQPVAGDGAQYAQAGAAAQAALLASNNADSQLLISLAAAEPLTAEGTLFVMQFKLLQDVNTPEVLTVESADCRIDAAQYGTVTQAALQVTVTQTADPCEGYTDINRSAWYHTAADFVIERGLMGSTKTDALTFEPNTKVSRAMVASILYRMANSPAASYKATFTDVPEGKWFTAAIEWCAQNGLASGKGNGKFDPNGNVTRQELAVFMKKMAEYLEKPTDSRDDLTSFADASKVPSWAKDYVAWAVSAGLISGKSSNGKTYLAPTDNATRAEFASIIMRFAQNIAEP